MRWQNGIYWQLAATRGFSELLLGLFGALGYGLLEIFWRGCTHWSMLLAGAFCVFAIDHLDRTCGGIGDWGKACLGGLIITMVELTFGVVFNFWARAGVWDYSALPFNFQGQICLYYALLWVVIAKILLNLLRWLRRGL